MKPEYTLKEERISVCSPSPASHTGESEYQADVKSRGKGFGFMTSQTLPALFTLLKLMAHHTGRTLSSSSSSDNNHWEASKNCS